MVFGLFDQLQIFSQLYLIELPGLLTGLGLLQLWHLMYPRLLTGFGMLVFTNLSLTEFQVTYLTLFLSNRQLQVVPDGMSLQEYPVNAGVSQGSIFGPTLFLLYLSDLPHDVICDIAIYVNDILSALSVIRYTICGSNLNWLLNLNLIYETLWTGVRSGLLILMLGKLNWFCLKGLITMVLLMWKWIGLYLRKNHLLRCWGWHSFLNWIGAHTLSLLLKLPPRKLEL